MKIGIGVDMGGCLISSPVHPSNVQHATFQTPDKHMPSFHQTSKGTSPRQPSTTPSGYFSQNSQHIKISAKQAINNESSILEGMNIKERIGNLGLICLRTYATRHRAKPILQSLSTEVCPVNYQPAWSTEKIEASIIHVPHMSEKSIEARIALRS